jgi:aminoglycoside phosphotransferase family enzyme/predicted kinase
MSNEPAWIGFLSDPASYNGQTSAVTVRQTHISWVFITDDIVIKVKKPVDFGFLDFTTLEKRKFFCEEEVRLNRRLCPDIYLGVQPLARIGNGFEINGAGSVEEWMVVMNRMPEEGMMGRLIEQEMIDETDIDAITAQLVPFYESAREDDFVRQFGSIETVRENTRENFEQTAEFTGSLIDKSLHSQLEKWNEDFMASRKALFNNRIKSGRIREGHGDLYSANICFDRANRLVHIFDCIEFNDRFRCGDVAVDVAFLAMDLDYHGLPLLSRYFISEFAKRTGDKEMIELVDFYKCYRAVVRGKIGCFTYASREVPAETREKAEAEARAYFRLAGRYAGCVNRPVLYAVCGLSGTGKSTLASALARQKGCAVYNSDIVRKELAGISPDESRKEPFEQGIYSREMTERTYRAMNRLAGRELMQGNTVICDATYSSSDFRSQLEKLADAADADIYFIHCVCDDNTARERLEKRNMAGDSPSDGRWEIYLQQKKNFDPFDNIPHERVKQVDTSGDITEIVRGL